MADLAMMGDEDPEEDFFKYKISAKDYELLQKAKQMEGLQVEMAPQLGFVNQNPQAQQIDTSQQIDP